MCGPDAGAFVQLGASILSGAATAGAGAAQADSLRAEADLREQEAGRIRQLGLVQENQVRRRNRILLEQQRVDFVAAGLDPTFGTPLDVAFQSAEQGELDALAIRTDTNLRAEAREAEARFLDDKAGSVQTGGFLSGASKVLTGIGQFAALS